MEKNINHISNILNLRKDLVTSILAYLNKFEILKITYRDEKFRNTKHITLNFLKNFNYIHTMKRNINNNQKDYLNIYNDELNLVKLIKYKFLTLQKSEIINAMVYYIKTYQEVYHLKYIYVDFEDIEIT